MFIMGLPLGVRPARLRAAPLPRADRQATWLAPLLGLGVGTSAQDTALAAQAALALAQELANVPAGFFGYPLYGVTAERLRQLSPGLRPEDAVVIAEALGYSRGVPPLLAPNLQSLFLQHLMRPILNGESSVAVAAQQTSIALEEVLPQ
jgi:hypothetical protein